MDEEKSRRRRLLRNFLLGLVIFLVYAYAVQIVDINLRTPQEPRRQDNLINMLRQMARPDFFTYNYDTQRQNLSFYSPCPEQLRASQLTFDGRTVTLTPNCADTTQDPLTFSGEGFPPHARGALRWYPPGDGIAPRLLVNFRADDQGRFSERFTMGDVRTSEEVQRVEIEEILDSEISGFSEASSLSWERILETILMALMASTIATLIAVPVSFIAARNLMVNVNAPLAAVMAAITAIPVGAFLANLVAQPIVNLSAAITNEATVLALGATLMAVALVWPVLQMGPPVTTDSSQSPGTRAFSVGRIVLAILLLLFSLVLLANLGLLLGRWLTPQLGSLRFLGTFLVVMSDLVRVMFPLFLGLSAIFTAMSMGSRYGEDIIFRLAERPARFITGLLTATGTAVLIYGIGSMLNWFYQFENIHYWTTIPAIVGAIVFGLLALSAPPKRQFPIGLTIYALSRSTLNLLRAIEPLILGTIFVVWVGIGPFAGILALTLNSIADLGKLFSEQVENIEQGPIEAITATGASRLQMIVYAVVPQIVPPFIAFAFYRWDINVRLSTIIGFVGGGGIGVILIRYTNLLQYRQAAVMIIAIAVVVSLLDYASSELRKRLI